ncbi:MAG: FAD-binding protein, partial [Ostreibacterium sp.]
MTKLNIQQHIDLISLTTFHTVAIARRLVTLDNKHQLNDLSTLLNQENFIILGSGSNVLFTDDYHGTVILNRLSGIKTIEETSNRVKVTIAAGEIWHDIVINMSNRGYYGLENLALIPGTIGAAVVQNIGAYGVEINRFITS